MKEIVIKLVIIVVLMSLFFLFKVENKKEIIIEDQNQEVLVEVTIDGNINYVALDDYLIGVLAGEMPAEFEMEALKAQAVASRTFVYHRDLKVDNTTNSQVYLTDEQLREKWGLQYDEYYQKIKTAVVSTDNQVMKYQGDFISALFFSSSNGYSENVEDYFQGAPVAYLKSVDSHWDLTTDPHNQRSKSFSPSELQAIFNLDEIDFNIIAYKQSGRVATLSVGNQQYTGREIREKLNLASSCFEIDYENGQYVFTTYGSGHGVGMSQYGAQGMALQGASYQAILTHYYTDVEIVSC